jgi:hypothetical protein
MTRAGSPKRAEWLAKTNHWSHRYIDRINNINIFSHEPEIRTFTSNVHSYNPETF